MKNLTTLAKVHDRVDALSQNCFDQLIEVYDISFDSMDTMKIGNEPHNLRTIAQRSIARRLAFLTTIGQNARRSYRCFR